MKISKNQWVLCGLAVGFMGLVGCGSSSSDSDEPSDEETALNDSATATSVSMDATGSGIQMSLEELIDSESTLVKGVTKFTVAVNQTETCPGGGEIAAEGTIVDQPDGTGTCTGTFDLDNCGGATGVLDVECTYSGYSDDGTNITVDAISASVSGSLVVTVDDIEYELTYGSGEASLNMVIVGGNTIESTLTGNATVTSNLGDATCEWLAPGVNSLDPTAILAGCEASD